MPSRDIANRMRVWPYSTTSVTLNTEITAPAASTIAGHDWPVRFCENRRKPGFLAFELGGRLDAESGHSDQHVERSPMIRAAMIAIGRLRLGSSTSSPAVETASRPT